MSFPLILLYSPPHHTLSSPPPTLSISLSLAITTILMVDLVSRAAIDLTTVYLATVSSAVSMCSSTAVVIVIAEILTRAVVLMTAAVRRRARVFVDDVVPAFCG